MSNSQETKYPIIYRLAESGNTRHERNKKQREEDKNLLKEYFILAWNTLQTQGTKPTSELVRQLIISQFKFKNDQFNTKIIHRLYPTMAWDKVFSRLQEELANQLTSTSSETTIPETSKTPKHTSESIKQWFVKMIRQKSSPKSKAKIFPTKKEIDLAVSTGELPNTSEFANFTKQNYTSYIKWLKAQIDLGQISI